MGEQLIEAMESRRLFAASLSLDGTVLSVTGTDGSDSIFVMEDAQANVPTFEVVQQINGVGIQLGSITDSMLTRIVLDGGRGDDFLVLQTSNAIGGDVFGGEGNDNIHLEDDGSAVSIAHGGNGDDLLVIFDGNGTEAHGD